jgi:hypothetical protein|tara:strand:- start:1559 stop:3250 length:1692 start_codon:yes stop_codon:yes gene_type:complete
MGAKKMRLFNNKASKLIGIKKETLSNNVTVTSRTEKDMVETRFITLSIYEVSEKLSADQLTLAEEHYTEIKDAGIPSEKIESLLRQAKKAFEEKDYKLSKELSEKITALWKNALTADELIKALRRNLAETESRGINIDEARNLLNLAIAAFEREDYEAAIQRAKEAQMTHVLLSKGRINILWLLQQYWWALIFSAIIISATGVIIKKKFALTIISRKLEDLTKEETSINSLMLELQEKTFKKKKISTTEYHKQMYPYETRLGEIRKEKAKLRDKRAGIIKVSNEIERLKKEDKVIITKIKHLQEAYYNKQSITKKAYTRKIEEYKLRRIELERAIAVMETRLGKKKKLDKLKEKEHLKGKKKPQAKAHKTLKAEKTRKTSKKKQKHLSKFALPNFIIYNKSKKKQSQKTIKKKKAVKNKSKIALLIIISVITLLKMDYNPITNLLNRTKNKSKKKAVSSSNQEKPTLSNTSEDIISFPIGNHISLREPSTSLTVNDLVLQTKTFARVQDKRQILSILADEFNINNLQQKPERKEQEPIPKIFKIIFKPKPRSIINNLKEVYGR